MITPFGHTKLRQKTKHPYSKLIDNGNDTWSIKPVGLSTASGSLIRMYDNSTKQIQDVEVGDVVKSYWPTNMSLQDMDSLSYTTGSLTGTMSGSVVTGIINESFDEYYLINGSIKIPSVESEIMNNSMVFSKKIGTWSWSQPATLSVGNKLLDKDGSEVNIDSISLTTGNTMFYSLDVEDIDTYFQSDILVHNIPKKF